MREMLRDVFQAAKIGDVRLANRFVRSATWEGMATEDGFVTPRLVRYVERLAEGGVGLIVSSHAYVSREGQAGPWQLGICDDAQVPGLRELCDAVHRQDGVIFAQLAHAGVNANAALSGLEPVGPSDAVNARGEKAREMTEAEVARLVEAFAVAAGRAVEAGFDGVQIHAGHGYCLSQFLSPFYNLRADRYGGSVDGRAAALLETHAAIRSVVESEFPVTVKMNAEDFIEGGFTKEMMVETAVLLDAAGFDAMEMSGGGVHNAKYRSSRTFDPRTPEEEAYYRDAARMYKACVKRMPLMLVGGIRSLEVANALLVDGMADMISMSRPFIREPDLIRRWQGGDWRRARCISCDGCRKPVGAGEGLGCVLEPV